MKKPMDMIDKIAEQKNFIAAYRDQVNEAYNHALFFYKNNPPDPIRRYKESLDAEFARLVDIAEHIETNEEYDYVQDRAVELLNSKAFIYPPNELETEARAKYEEIKLWKVPSEQREPVEHALKVIAGEKSSEEDKRAHLLKLYESYDELDDYVDWIYKNLMKTGIILFAATILGLLLSIVFLTLTKWMIPAVLMAGTTGAALSVLTRMPPRPTRIGTMREFYVRAISRFATGILATIIGYGFLAANLISLNIGFNDTVKSVADLLNGWDWEKVSIFDVFLIISIGVILGFTERLFSRFSSSLFSAKEDAKKESEA